tara:strand:+ start:292 stop:1146 length:855 start_codon:yes stop_codon:yes gene_type:complete
MIIEIFLPLSLVFIMFTLGIGLTLDDFKNIFRYPKAFGVGIVNQMVLLPMVAFIILSLISLPGEMAVGMMILACCPGGVTSNMITKLAKGDTALSISFTAAVSILAVVTLPLVVGFSMKYFIGSDAPEINILSLGLTMFFITTVPVSVGLYVHTRFKNKISSFAKIANKISTVLFVIIVIGALASEWTTFVNNIQTLGPAVIALLVVMFFLGYNSSRWFKISPKMAITVAIESGIQNATVGITIGSLILRQEGGLSVFSLPSGVYGIVMYFVCLPFVFWFIKNK